MIKTDLYSAREHYIPRRIRPDNCYSPYCIKISNPYFCVPFRKNMEKTKSRAAIIALGILVAFASLCSHASFFSSGDISKKQSKTEQQESEEEIYFSTPSTSLPSPVHVTLQPTVFFLFEIVFEEIGKAITDTNLAIPAGQFFRTIFGVIISPNAP